MLLGLKIPRRQRLTGSSPVSCTMLDRLKILGQRWRAGSIPASRTTNVEIRRSGVFRVRGTWKRGMFR